MAAQGMPNSMHCLVFSLGIVVAISGSLFSMMDGACLAQAGEFAQGESISQSMDMDLHDHGEGTVDMIVPHQKHLGPHMKWTMLRPTNADDERRADQIVQTLVVGPCQVQGLLGGYGRRQCTASSRANAKTLSSCQ